VKSAFEFFVAGRYLRARRKEKVISVITVISVIGVAAGVMALVVSLGVNNGFRNTLQKNLLAATAAVNVSEKETGGEGIANWPDLTRRFEAIPHVVAVAPVLYDEVLLSGPMRGKYATLKGVIVERELGTSSTLRHLKTGSLASLTDDDEGLPSLIVGSKLAEDTGMLVNSVVTAISLSEMTPFGPEFRKQRFRVAGTFETDFYQVDDTWAYAPIASMRKLLQLGNVVNQIELRIDNIDLAPEVAKEVARVAGNRYAAIPWQEQNHEIFQALEMERRVMAVTIGMIELVGALNIFITLTMIVMTKYKDIAVLMSMGARRAQIRLIFVLQGAMIGVVGTTIGLAAGYSLCYFADKYRWVPLNESVYALSFVPFEPRAWDGVWIAAAALTVSLLATLYPARNATRITPVEVLRYE
jgi:lipoprotein-releasing system permease protein